MVMWFVIGRRWVAKRKKTGLTSQGFSVSPGFNLRNQFEKLERQKRLRRKRRKGPTISPRRARRVG